jgi:hypothetical protein
MPLLASFHPPLSEASFNHVIKEIVVHSKAALHRFNVKQSVTGKSNGPRPQTLVLFTCQMEDSCFGTTNGHLTPQNYVGQN